MPVLIKCCWRWRAHSACSNNSDNELVVTCEVGEGKYQKHYIYLNSYTLYVVEDISGADVDPYHYELNIIPEMVGGVKVTSKK